MIRDLNFYDFLNLSRWERDSYSGLSQLVFDDALFLKSPKSFLTKHQSNQKIATYLVILALYNRFDVINYVQKNFTFMYNNDYQELFQVATKFRNQLNRINFIFRVLNATVKAISPNFRFHLIN